MNVRTLLIGPRLASVAVAAGLALTAIGTGPASASAPSVLPRIVGGAPIASADAPWQVLFVINNGTLCSGSLISATTVVSAAHCFAGVAPGAVQGWTGVTNIPDRGKGTKLSIAAVTVHPAYNPATSANDVAVVQLGVPADLAGVARTIALPVSQDPATWPAVGTGVTISGWGATSDGGAPSDHLRAANVQILGSPTDPCGAYGASFSAATTICAGLPAGGVDACQGDSGGPLVATVNGLPVLAGLTSTGGACASAQLPGLYTRLTTYVPWLQQQADIAVAAPGAPSVVAAKADAGKTTVSWTAAPQAGSGSTAWTVTASPGGQTCTTLGSSCAVPGLKAGSQASFTVQGRNAFGPGPASAATASSLIVTSASAPGQKVAAKTIAQWLGLKGSGAVKARSTSPAVCKVAGSSVTMLAPGQCSVSVTRGKAKAGAVILVS